jgi:hypothetical protein
VFEQITAPASSIVNGICFQGLSFFPIDAVKCTTKCARASDLTDSSSWSASRLTCSGGITVVGYHDFFTPTGTCDTTSPAPSDTTTTAPTTSAISATSLSTRDNVTQSGKNDTGTIVGGSMSLTDKSHVTRAGCSQRTTQLSAIPIS